MEYLCIDTELIAEEAMIDFIARKFVKDYDNYKSPEVRQGYGVLCGIIGIILNIILFFGKITVGIVSGSLAIIADAINNLSDAGSSLIMMIGFKMAGREADAEHPFGHGRIEYIVGMIVSMLIILLGFELGKSSIAAIVTPKVIDFNMLAFVIIVVSILIKIYMFFYNKKIAERISSTAMKTVAKDSITDAASTGVVLISMLIGYYTGLSVDGWIGLVIAIFILYTGVTSAKDTIDPLLGSKPGKEYVETIEKFVLSNDGILGMHDLVVHDYGPGRVMISLHAEVSANGDILELHDTIDNMEKKLHDSLGCHAVIHLDPIVVDDEITDRMRRLVTLVVKSVNELFSIHDFRMVKGPTHTNLIFDILAPYESGMSEEEIKAMVKEKIESLPGNHYAVINIDRPMV